MSSIPSYHSVCLRMGSCQATIGRISGQQFTKKRCGGSWLVIPRVYLAIPRWKIWESEESVTLEGKSQ